MPGREPIHSVVKAASVVKAVARSQEGLRLSEIAAELGLKVPATHHMVRTLVSCGFLARRGSLVVLGDDLLALARSEQDTAFQAQAAVEMQRLFASLPRCTVVLGEAGRFSLELTQRISYERPHVLQRVRGQSFHVYGNAAGLVALAFGGPELREHLGLRHPFAEQGANLWGTREDLERHLADGRVQGYLECPFDRDISYRVAVPLFSMEGELVGALGASVPASQLSSGDDPSRIAAELRESAVRLAETAVPKR